VLRLYVWVRGVPVCLPAFSDCFNHVLRIPEYGREQQACWEFFEKLVSCAAMNLRLWLIVAVLWGFIPSNFAASQQPSRMERGFLETQANADTADQEIKSCEAGKDADLRITICTEIIRKNPGATHKLGLAYFLRGNAYQTKQDYEHAIADYDESLRLMPSIAPVVKNRGVAYAHKGDYDRSI